MLSKPTKSLAHNLHLLVQTPMWLEVSAFLVAELQAIHERMESAVESHMLHELRGRAKSIRELLALSRSTGELLTKFNKEI